MPTRADVYKGLDNRDLKMINAAPWDMPHPLRNEKVRAILVKINIMEPGEVIRIEGLAGKEVWLVRSAVWRMVRRHEMDAIVTVRECQLYIRKPE